MERQVSVDEFGSGRTCHVISQSHIDMAWLWRWEETIEFIRATFEASADILEQHRDATFSQSQLLAYEAVQHRFPQLFERIKRLVAAGRWEVVGGELVESDHVIASGESLVRQLVYGQLYARNELGTQARVGWSPDSFGHNGNLPQILHGAGIDFFVYKRPLVGEQDVPVTPFWWEGIDGSRILAYRTTNKGWDFVTPIPSDVAERHNVKHTWGYSGTGDRGGVRPYKQLGQDQHGKHIHSTPTRFFEAVRAEAIDLPVVSGELNYCYEGTYSTHADIKIANRRCENLLNVAESLAAAARIARRPYPAELLREAWKRLCFNQFHDILPGTSIHEVYEDAARDYGWIESTARRVIDEASKTFVEPSPDSEVAYDATTRRFEPVAAQESAPLHLDNDLTLDNGVLRVTVSPVTGWIEQIVDLRSGRQLLAAPGGNVLSLWREDSFAGPSEAEWNAWDIGVSEHFEHAQLSRPPVRTASDSITCEHMWGSSGFRSAVTLGSSSDWIDFQLECDWQETLVLLRTEFALELSPEAEAWHEIAYGAVRRQKNGAEVPAYRWVDISDAESGAALISNSRCAHSVLANTVRMTLLRCATNPDPISDRGRFTFRYRLKPHSGTWREGDVVASACELNLPRCTFLGRAVRQTDLPTVEGTGVYVGACKLAEDGEAVVMRVYEAHGRKAGAHVSVPSWCTAVAESNLLEDCERELTSNDGVDLQFEPFELKTLLFRLSPAE